MKKIYLLGLALSMFSAVNAQTTVIDDGFETYDLGGLHTGHWQNWYLQDADESLDMAVTDRKAATGNKSGYIGVQNDNKGQDAILVMPQIYTNGKITMSWKMFIPTDSMGYFNLQSTAIPGETDASFAVSCEINTYSSTDSLADGTNLANKIVWTASDGTSSYYYAYAPITTDTWFTVKQVWDLDNKVTHFYIDDVPATYYYFGTEGNGGNVWPGQDTAIASVDFFSLADTSASNGLYNSYYIDDVKVIAENVTGVKNIEKNSNLVSLYPNPAKDHITLFIKDEKMTNIEVFNISGQKVLNAQPNNNTADLNIQRFAAGVYTAKVTTKSGTFTKEFVVKK